MKKLIRFSLAAGAAVVLVLPALAQSPVQPTTYPLTNAAWNLANGSTNLANGTSTLNSAAFPIWRGRGFVLHSAFYGTNAGTDNLTFTLQTCTPYSSGGTWHTNWSTVGTTTAAVAQNGTTEVFGYSLIPPTTFDNERLCRISTVANAHASSLFMDPTNTFISVIP
jgi:hypothetical protein